MTKLSIYFAGKLSDAPLARECMLKAPQFLWNARWPWFESVVPDEPEFAENFWVQDIADIADSDCVLLWAVDHGKKQKGALVEVGAAIGMGKRVLVVTTGAEKAKTNTRGVSNPYHPDLSTWQCHPQVRVAIAAGEARDAVSDPELVVAMLEHYEVWLSGVGG